MRLEGRNLSSRMRGDDVSLLHKKLIFIGFQIPEDEIKNKYFGKTTRRAVRELQSKHELRNTGVVDEATVILLNDIVSKRRAFREFQSGRELKNVSIVDEATAKYLTEFFSKKRPHFIDRFSVCK